MFIFWSLDSDSLALGVYGVGARPPGWRMGGSTESVVDQHTLGEGNSDFKPPTALHRQELDYTSRKWSTPTGVRLHQQEVVNTSRS